MSKINSVSLILLVLMAAKAYGAVSHSNILLSNVETSPIRVFQVANVNSVYQTDHFNVSLVISNQYFEDIHNVSIKFIIPPEIDFLSCSIPDFDIGYNTSQFEYNYDLIEVEESFHLQTVYNTTSSTIQNLTIPSVTISYQLSNGMKGVTLSNTIEIALRGVKHTLSIPQIIFPNGGEIFNDSIQISWKRASDSYNHSIMYTLFFSVNNGSTWILLKNNLTENNFHWNITTVIGSSTYMIRIIATCPQGLISEDISDAPFTIEEKMPSQTTSGQKSSQDSTTSSWSVIWIVIFLGTIISFRNRKRSL